MDSYVEKRRQPGDDQELALLTMELGYESVTEPKAKAVTQSVGGIGRYIRQQVRWHRSFYREWKRIKVQHTGQDWIMTSFFWLRSAPIGPLRIYALCTRNHTKWGTR